MLVLVTAAVIVGALTIAVLAKLRATRNVESTRSVLLHVPIDRAWELVQDFPALFAAHGRGRPLLSIQSSGVQSGGGTAATVWRQQGTWAGRPYSADIELLEVAAPHFLAVRLVRDTLGSERGLLRHRGEVRLRAVGARSTKITWQLTARLHSLPLLLGRVLVPERVEARLLDLSLRSLKAAIDGGTRPAGAGHAPPFPIPRRAATPLSMGASSRESIGAQQQR